MTPQEKLWLEQHPDIRLGPYSNYPPIQFLDKKGNHTGVVAEYVDLIQASTGIVFENVHTSNWQELLDKAKSRDLDVVGLAAQTSSRSEYLSFTRPYMKLPAVILTKDSVGDSLSMKDLEGLKVAVTQGYAVHDYLRENFPNIILDPVADTRIGLRKVSFGLVDAFVSDLAVATYYAQQEGINNLKVVGESGFVYEMGFAVRNDWPELVSILDKALALISFEQRQDIYQHWVYVHNKNSDSIGRLLYAVLSGLILAILGIVGVLLWNHSLRRQVDDRTQELKAVNCKLEQKVQASNHDVILANEVLKEEVSLRKTINKNLLASESQFRAVFEDAGIGMSILNQNGFFVKVNHVFCDFFGFLSDDFLEMRFEDLLDKNNLFEFQSLFSKALKVDSKNIQLEQNCRCKDGSSLWVRLTLSAISEKNQRDVRYVVGMVENISQRKIAEDERERFFEISMDIMCVVSMDGFFRRINKAFTDTLGYSEEDLLTRPLIEFIHPDDRQRTIDELSSLSEGIDTYCFRNRYMCSDGSFRWLEWNATQFLEDSLIYAVARDVTDRIRLQNALLDNDQKIRHFVKHTPVAVAMFDLDMKYILASHQWLDDYGLKEENVIGVSHYEIMPQLSERWKIFHQSCLRGNIEKSDKDRISFMDGRTEWIRWEMHPWRNNNGDVEGIIIFREVISSQISTQEKLEKYRDNLELQVERRTTALREMNERLQQEIFGHHLTESKLEKSYDDLKNLSAHLQDVREQERTGIAREIHDELGQSLTALKMDLSWFLKTQPLASEPIKDKINDMIQLVNSTIKSVQKISSDLRPGILDDLGLVAAIEWQAEDFQRRSGIRCVVDVSSEDLDLDAQYTTAIFRIFQETLTNVIRHAKATRVDASLKLENSNILLSVCDNGVGIRKEHINRSDAFGLMGMRERVSFLEGTIDFQGAQGKGTSVSVVIPVAEKKGVVYV